MFMAAACLKPEGCGIESNLCHVMAAWILGVSYRVMRVVAKVCLGSYSDSLGRRPMLRAYGAAVWAARGLLLPPALLMPTGQLGAT